MMGASPVTVTADDATRPVATPNPAFTGTFVGLKLGDDPSVFTGLVFDTTAVRSSRPGEYPISSSGGVAINYVIESRVNGTLTVTAGRRDSVPPIDRINLPTGFCDDHPDNPLCS